MDIPRKSVRIVKLDNTIYTYLNQYSVEFMKVATDYRIEEYESLAEVLKVISKFLNSD